MNRKISKLLAWLIAFCVTFTSLPLMTGSLDVSAASYWNNISGKANSQTAVTLSWKQLTKKQRKKIGGIAVFRNGDVVAKLSKTAKNFTDTGLKAGTSYTYQVKTYKKVTKKTTMWLNKKTGQWQKKKPAKKYRGKKKTFKKISYKYSNASKAVTVKTAGASAGRPASGSSAGTDAQFVNTTKDLKDRTYDLASLPSSVEYGNGTVVFEVFSEGTVTWTSSNTAVATVTSKFSGSECCMTIKGVGKTTITAKSSRGPSKSFVVTVVDTSGTNPGTNPGGGGTSGGGQVLYEEDAKRELDRLGISYTPVTTTDYLGKTHAYYQYGDYYYGDLLFLYKDVVTHESTYGRISGETLTYLDRNRDGTFKDGDTTYRQLDGVTFNQTLLDNPENTASFEEVTTVRVEMYNGDFSKLTFNVHDTQEVSTYNYRQEPITKTFVMKSGKRLARYEGEETRTESKGLMIKEITVNGEGICDGTGFISGDVNVDIDYDGKRLATWAIPVNENANASGHSPYRQVRLQLAEEALQAMGKTGDFNTDMRNISIYIGKTYPYGYKYGNSAASVGLTCHGGMEVLETYSVYAFGIYGFNSWGQYANAEESPYHAAFHLDSNPKIYYQTNGYE